MDPSVPRPSDLLIRESADLAIIEAPGGGGPFNPDGTVDMVLIRPCNGRGPYNNIYEAEVLARDASTFKGWTMYDGHDSPAARKARMGLPRSVSELAGVVRESWWEPSYSTAQDGKMGFGQGAVIGKCKLTAAMEALIKDIPEAIKGSLNAQATNKRLGERNGARGWIVEGFVNDPENSSFDLVTKAGAGGRVASVLEGLYDESNATTGRTGIDQELDMDPADFVKTPEFTTAVQEAAKGAVTTVLTDLLPNAISEGIQAASADRENDIREAVREELGDAQRLRTLSTDARGIIENAPGLTAGAKSLLLEDYGLQEHDDESVTAGRSLRLVEAVVEDGKVTKTARQVLKDQLDADIKRQRAVISEAAPTIPRSPGGTGDLSVTESPVDDEFAQLAARRGLNLENFGFSKPEPTAA